MSAPAQLQPSVMGFLHHPQWGPKRWTLIMTIWSNPSLCGEWNIWSGRKEIFAGNASALMAHAAANLTYIIHEASESEQQHMFPHDACGLEVQQRCDSTPLRSDGNFSPSSRTQNGFQSRAQGASCLLVAWGQQRSFIRISLRTHHLKWVARKSYKHQSVMLAELVHSR